MQVSIAFPELAIFFIAGPKLSCLYETTQPDWSIMVGESGCVQYSEPIKELNAMLCKSYINVFFFALNVTCSTYNICK